MRKLDKTRQDRKPNNSHIHNMDKVKIGVYRCNSCELMIIDYKPIKKKK